MNKNLGEYREEEKKMGLMCIETNTSETGRGLSYNGSWRVLEGLAGSEGLVGSSRVLEGL